jgi:hypothetical protein
MQGARRKHFDRFAERTIEGAGYECGEAHFLIPSATLAIVFYLIRARGKEAGAFQGGDNAEVVALLFGLAVNVSSSFAIDRSRKDKQQLGSWRARAGAGDGEGHEVKAGGEACRGTTGGDHWPAEAACVCARDWLLQFC